MNRFKSKLKYGVVLATVTAGSILSAAVDQPTPDYTTIEETATTVFGIVLVVSLLYKAKNFYR